MKHLVFLVFLVGSCASQLFAQESFGNYWSEFQRAIKQDDEAKIVSLCQFPIKGNVDNIESENGYNEGEFLKDYDHYFDDQGRTSIRRTTVEAMTYADISDRGIPNLEFNKGYVLFISYEYPEFETDSTIIFTFAYINGQWKLARIDQAG